LAAATLSAKNRRIFLPRPSAAPITASPLGRADHRALDSTSHLMLSMVVSLVTSCTMYAPENAAPLRPPWRKTMPDLN
jgi:hypothetical protein